MRPSALGQEISVEPGNQALGEQWREINFPGGEGESPPLRLQLLLGSHSHWSGSFSHSFPWKALGIV